MFFITMIDLIDGRVVIEEPLGAMNMSTIKRVLDTCCPQGYYVGEMFPTDEGFRVPHKGEIDRLERQMEESVEVLKKMGSVVKRRMKQPQPYTGLVECMSFFDRVKYGFEPTGDTECSIASDSK